MGFTLGLGTKRLKQHRRRPQWHLASVPPIRRILRGNIKTELMPDRCVFTKQPWVENIIVRDKGLEAP